MAGKMSWRRLILWERDPHCHWCGTKTVWRERKGLFHDPRLATVDHLRSRLSRDRWQENRKGHERTVLACRRCNEERGAVQERELGVRELQVRSGRTPMTTVKLSRTGSVREVRVRLFRKRVRVIDTQRVGGTASEVLRAALQDRGTDE